MVGPVNAAAATTNRAGTGTDPKVVVVRPGDSLSAIAQRNGVSLAALTDANPALARQRYIHPGDRVTIPGTGSGGVYTVRPGDTLDAIAQRHGTTWQTLKTLNGMSNARAHLIHPGDQIRLPAGAVAANGGGVVGAARAEAAAAAAAGSGTRSVAGMTPNQASVNAAIYAENRVRGQGSQSLCYRYVKQALQHAGAVNTYLAGGSAIQAGRPLEQQGFVNVLNRPGANIRSAYDAPVGAVLVYRGGQHGHIEIRTPNGFASDYFSTRARTGAEANGLSGGGRTLVGVYIKPGAQSAAPAPTPAAPAAARPAAPAAPVHPTAPTSTTVLGSVSERYESGNRGPGTASSGRGDPGGASYGVYQLSSAKGTLTAFLRNEGAVYAQRLAGKPVGSDAFNREWRAIAAENPRAFRAAQHAFIERTHYDVAVNGVREQTGLNLDTRHRAIREAVWSVSVQHAGAQTILRRAIARTDAQMSRNDAGYDRALANNIYAVRTQYVLDVANGPRISASEKAQLISVTQNRYPAERADILALF